MASAVRQENFVIGEVMPIQSFIITPTAAEEAANTLDIDLVRYFRSISMVVSVGIMNSGVFTSLVTATIDGTTVTIAHASLITETNPINLTVVGNPVA